jgi:hypothetical protein
VKVNAFFLRDIQRFEKQVHEERLAAPDTAPKIQATDGVMILRAAEEPEELATRFCRLQPQPQVVEMADDSNLRGITVMAVRPEAFLICLANAQDSRYPFSAFYNRAQRI